VDENRLNLFPVSGVLFASEPNQTNKIIHMTTNLTRYTLATLAAALSISAAVAAEDAPSAPLPPASTKAGLNYATDIKPILDANCVKCHSGKKPKAHLHLDSLAGILKGTKHGPVLKPGEGANSLIVKAVAHQLKDHDGWMPPMPNKAGAKTLTPEQIGVLIGWINQGAK
jgi:hypothetical protein